MFDLGTSFLASVARDPDALAIVDDTLRLTYQEWYRRISSVVAGLDALGLKPGDHLVTVLQNRWEEATIHWACQFAGIIVTPVNWRATADDLDFFCADAGAKALIYEDVSAEAARGCRAGCPGMNVSDFVESPLLISSDEAFVCTGIDQLTMTFRCFLRHQSPSLKKCSLPVQQIPVVV